MKTYLYRFLISIIIGITCSFWLENISANEELPPALSFQLYGGYRTDDLYWNIAGNLQGSNPNILSELTWEDVEIYQLKIKGKWDVGDDGTLPFTTFVKGEFGYGWIVDGKNQDSDYEGDNRTLEFSRSTGSTDGDDVIDLSFGFGFSFHFLQNKLSLSPVFGISYNEQNLNISDIVQTIPASGPLAGSSTYKTEWKGLLAGFDIEYLFTKKFSLFGSIEYHWGDYEGEGNWMLRPEFAHPRSFVHEDDYTGISFVGGASYYFTPNWSFGINVSYLKWKTDVGLDRVFLADGRTIDTQLNKVNWESSAVMVFITYSFY